MEKDVNASKTQQNDSTNSGNTVPKPPLRRAAARPKPNILGRGAATRNREIKPEVADPKPVEIENNVSTVEPKEAVTNDVVKEKVDDDDEVKESDKTPKTSETEEGADEPGCMINIIPDEEQDEKQEKENLSKKPPVPRFRSRFARARPNVEAVSRPRIR